MQRNHFWAIIAPWVLGMAPWSWELQELPMEEAGQRRVSQQGPIHHSSLGAGHAREQ